MALSVCQVPCMNCNSPVEMKLSPKPTVVNTDTFSLIMVEHPEQSMCPKCGCVCRACIVNIGGIAIMAAPVPKEEQQNIIVPGNGGILTPYVKESK